MSSPTDAARTPAAANARKALRFAFTARVLSWLAAAAGLGAVVLFLVQAGLFAALMPATETSEPFTGDADQSTASDSTLSGLDRQNQPYEVTAKRGWQDKDKPNLVHLETIAASFRKVDGKTYALTSQTGLYDTKIKELDLAGDVTITEGARFAARMAKAHVVVEQKSLTSDVPVDVTMGGGTIKANGLQITDDGARILFLNGVKARFGADAEKGDQTP